MSGMVKPIIIITGPDQRSDRVPDLYPVWFNKKPDLHGGPG